MFITPHSEKPYFYGYTSRHEFHPWNNFGRFLLGIGFKLECIKKKFLSPSVWMIPADRLRLKCDGTRAETRFRLSAKRTIPSKSAGASVQSTTGSRDVRISGSNARYTMFRGSVKSTGYPLHSPVPPSLPLPSVTVCHHISTGLYLSWNNKNQNWALGQTSVMLFIYFYSFKSLQPLE